MATDRTRTELLVPSRLTTERLVVLPLTGDTVDSSLLHLPGLPIPANSTPYSWLSVCGVEGIVYAQAGPLALVPVCGACVSGESPVVEPVVVKVVAQHGSLSKYNRGCRCDDCRGANAAYSREYYRRKRAA